MFEDSVSGDNSFDIGSAIINVLTLSINNFDGRYSDYDFDGAEVVCYIGLALDDGTTEKVRICTTTVVEQPEIETVTIDLTCEDNMRKFDRDYSESKLIYPATRAQIIRDACSVCGVTLLTTSFDRDDYIVQKRPADDALTFRQVLQWVAQIGCQWLRCDEYGRLCVKWFDTGKTNPQEINVTYNFTPKHTDVVITGVKVTEYSDSSEDVAGSYISGTEGYVLGISDNKLIRKGDGETVASIIAEKCVGMRFRPFDSGCPTNVALEAGDAIIITDRNGKLYNTYLTTTTLHPGSGQTIACNAKSAAKNSSTRYSQATQTYVDARNLVEKEKNERKKAIENLQESLSVGSGLFATYVQQEDGSTISYFHDKASLAESKNVIKITSEAIGVSNDGGKTYPFGFELTGTMITKLLYAEGINADYIDSGALTVKDKGGNIIFQVNMDTNTVYMNPDILIIGDQTLTEKLTAMDDSIAEAKNMTMQLTNDYQSITTDADGNITGTFPTVTTTAQVMYGTNDVTNDCTYTITKSNNVTGSWNDSTHTYTVTGLSADNGWVDIKSTYLRALSITKRFTVAKLKAGKNGLQGDPGAEGKPGRTYIIEPSCTVLKRGSDKVISPNFLEFNAYYRDGDSATRYAYSGRFVIEETADGNTWKTIYTSSANEISVKHYLYTILTDGSGQTVTDGNGTTVGIPRDITNIRCKLYAAGGTTDMLDMQSVAVVIDVDNLTQTDIVNILSNNGAWKGLYYKNGQLYISFSAALGGELALGGANNGNGVLYLYDEDGRLLSLLDNRGLLCGYDLRDANDYFAIPSLSGYEMYEWDEVEGVLMASQRGVGMRWSANQDNRYALQMLADYEFEIYLNDGVDSVSNPYTPLRCTHDYTEVFNQLKTHSVEQYTNAYTLMLKLDGTVVRSASSAKRYKDVREDIDAQSIENWYSIQTVWAKYKDGYLSSEDENSGKYMPMFLADDVEQHMPEAAIHMDGKIEDWNYRVMIPAMFAMLKQQKSEIDSLKQELDEVKQFLRKE
nr:MAG TPA: Receptor recognition protein, Long tail, Helical sandwich, Tail fiber [Caudoviricetes sp.]